RSFEVAASGVAAGRVVPADPQQIDKSVQSLQGSNLRSRDVIPPDWDLDRFESEQLADVEYLGVESEPPELLAGEDGAGRILAKQLEAALRVMKLEAGDQPHHQVEEAPRVFAEHRLM